MAESDEKKPEGKVREHPPIPSGTDQAPDLTEKEKTGEVIKLPPAQTKRPFDPRP